VKECLENDIRLKYPAVARGADYERSATKAIKGFCITCCGGSPRAVAECWSRTCWLWRFRPYGDRERPDGLVPTQERLAEISNARGCAEALSKRREDET